MAVASGAGGGDSRAINPEVVAEIANLVKTTLDGINEQFDQFQTGVLNPIKEAWYNENALKIMPDATKNLNKVDEGVNLSLESLGSALGSAVTTWAAANGGSYAISPIAAAAKQLACDVQDNKGGFKGMDVADIQTAINQAEAVRDSMIQKLSDLQAAGEREGFRGGAMQSRLNDVCSSLKNQINTAIGTVIDEITTNTGTAKGNVESATSSTESTFTIN